jgi:glycosyltransferase involved in cell wall biosynthesis
MLIAPISDRPRVSVIVPVRDQPDALAVTLSAFRAQSCEQSWELIVVDDGSQDETPRIAAAARNRNLRLLRGPPRGRAAARNAGLAEAAAEICIFCDADRAPCRDFVAAHLMRHARIDEGDSRVRVVVGDIMEFYVSDLKQQRRRFERQAAADFKDVLALARKPPYSRVVLGMFDQSGNTDFAIPWIAFFSGNVSLSRAAAVQFDEDFVAWGLEHFELGLRLCEQGAIFRFEPLAVNFHFSHPRPKGFYADALKDSFVIFTAKHPTRRAAALWPFLHGQISLETFEAIARQELGMAPAVRSGESFYRQQARAASG